MKNIPSLAVSSLAALLALSALPAHAADTATPAAPAAPRTFNFGNNGSAELITKAWQAHAARDHEAVAAYVNRCRELYFEAAVGQQAALTAPVPTDNREAVFANWALNDVGTGLFILGQSLEQGGKNAEAITAYKLLVEKLAFAQCWDEKGWFWSPADAARGRLRALEFESAQF